MGKLGRFVDILAPHQEDRVLTTQMRGGSYMTLATKGPCLVGVVCMYGHIGSTDEYMQLAEKYGSLLHAGLVEYVFDRAVIRFGDQRVGTAIRNRILRNRARRELANVKPVEAVNA